MSSQQQLSSEAIETEKGYKTKISDLALQLKEKRIDGIA